MQILIISYYFPPMNSVASHRIYSWARTWSDIGHDVTVLTAPKPYGENQLQVDTSNLKIIEASCVPLDMIQKFGGKKKADGTNSKKSVVKSVLTKVNNWRKKRGLFYTLRMPDYLSLWKHPALKKVKHKKFDVIVSSFGPYVTHLIAEKMIKSNNADKWIADFRDPWVDNMIMKGLFPFTIIEKRIYRRILKHADIVTTVSKPIAQKITKESGKENVHVIYNGYFEYEYQKEIIKKKSWTDNKIRLLYTGTIYEGARDYNPLLKALREIIKHYPNAEEELEIVIAGRTAGNLPFEAAKHNVMNLFNFTGNIPYYKSLAMQVGAHVLLFFDLNPVIMEGALSSKIFEYFASGTEIWSIGSKNIDTEANRFIVESNTGIIFGDDSEMLFQEIQKLLDTKNKPVRNRNMSFIKQFTRESQARKMLDLVLECSSGSLS